MNVLKFSSPTQVPPVIPVLFKEMKSLKAIWAFQIGMYLKTK